jgi:hypothetical protein
MRRSIGFIAACLAAHAWASDGPSLGVVRDVVITETGSYSYPDRPPEDCSYFSLSVKKIRALLQRAVIITPLEEHSEYFIGNCFIRGTATFGGRTATWEFGSGGTGTIVLYEDVKLLFADPEQRYRGE